VNDRTARTFLTRPFIAVSLISSLACTVVWLLLFYYRPTLEISDDEPLGGLALAIVLPFAFSAALAYTPALRQSARLAAAFCLAVGLAELVYSRATDVDGGAGIAVDAVLALVPMAVLFAASRLPVTRLYSWTFLLVGPVVFWVGVLLAVLIAIPLIPNPNP